MVDFVDMLCRSLMRQGSLAVTIGPTGKTRLYGDGSASTVAVRFRDGSAARATAFNPSLALGEAYMDGRLTIEKGDVYDLLHLLMTNQMLATPPAWIRIADQARHAVRRFAQRNDPWHAARNIAHHYDLPDAFYDLFLDPARQYSCAYFAPGDDLDTAQRRKMRHIAAKLQLSEGQRVLDIGCGWGGLGHYLARVGGVDVTGITLSRQQLKAARERSWRTGTARRVRFEYQDWRSAAGPYDRVVSVGMFEHVGIGNYAAYFAKIRELMSADGVALVHTIGRSDGPGFTNPFIAKHIFPGGYFPAMSEIVPAIERSGAVLADVEILRLHYADTLKAWRTRFVARWADACRIAGEPFCRGWEFYLAGAEAAFRCQGLVVFQLQLARRIDALPLTRDYITAREAEYAARESFGDDRPPSRASQ